MSDVQDASSENTEISDPIHWDDIQHAEDQAVLDWEESQLSKPFDFIIGTHGYCTLCKCVVREDSEQAHTNNMVHMLLYKQYLSKYSMLMHVNSTLYPGLRHTSARICAAYDFIIGLSSSNARNKAWESAFRYVAGQRTFAQLQRHAKEDEPENEASEVTSSRAQAPQCVCCWNTARDVMFRPCKHVVVCRTCSERLTECPVCRAPISEREVVYCS